MPTPSHSTFSLFLVVFPRRIFTYIIPKKIHHSYTKHWYLDYQMLIAGFVFFPATAPLDSGSDNFFFPCSRMDDPT